MAKQPRTAKTYIIYLCENGKKFKSILNWVSPQPSAGDTVDGRKIRGVISSGDGQLVLDVEPMESEKSAKAGE